MNGEQKEVELPPCASGCGEPGCIDDNRGYWWCVVCFFDPTKSVKVAG